MMKDLLADIKDTVQVLEEYLDNEAVCRFFAGKLHLLVKTMVEIINGN